MRVKQVLEKIKDVDDKLTALFRNLPPDYTVELDYKDNVNDNFSIKIDHDRRRVIFMYMNSPEYYQK